MTPASSRDIALDIRAQIERRELPAGAQVPGQNVLMERYGVAVGTANAVHALLKSWGLTEARPGVGTFVREHRALEHVMTEMTFPDGDGNRLTWREVAARQGMEGAQRVDGAGHAPAPAEVADKLGVDADRAVVWRRRHMLIDGRVIEIATSWFPPAVAALLPELASPERLPKNSPAMLADHGLATIEVRDRVVARRAGVDEAAVLGIDARDPVSDVLRVQYAADGSVVEVCSMVNDGYRMHSVWISRA